MYMEGICNIVKHLNDVVVYFCQLKTSLNIRMGGDLIYRMVGIEVLNEFGANNSQYQYIRSTDFFRTTLCTKVDSCLAR